MDTTYYVVTSSFHYFQDQSDLNSRITYTWFYPSFSFAEAIYSVAVITTWFFRIWFDSRKLKYWDINPFIWDGKAVLKTVAKVTCFRKKVTFFIWNAVPRKRSTTICYGTKSFSGYILATLAQDAHLENAVKRVSICFTSNVCRRRPYQLVKQERKDRCGFVGTRE